MHKLFFVANRDAIYLRSFEFDPLTVARQYRFENNYIAFQLIHGKSLVKFDVSPSTGTFSYLEVHAFEVTLVNENLDTDRYPQMETNIALGFDEKFTFEWEDFDASSCVHLFQDGIMIVITNELFQPSYYIYENRYFGVLIDKNCNLLAFVVRFFSDENYEQIIRNVSPENIKKIKDAHDISNIPMISIKDTAFVIKKILELKTIDCAKVLYYGLLRLMVIDSNFCILFAIEIIKSNHRASKDPIFHELQQLSGYDQRMIDLLKERWEQSDYPSSVYSEVWLYLLVAEDIKEMNLIS